MAATKFEMNISKKLRFEEGFGWVTKTLCTQKEASAFSLWNNNLGYQGILKCSFNIKKICGKILVVSLSLQRGDINSVLHAMPCSIQWVVCSFQSQITQVLLLQVSTKSKEKV
jgi:hypothetical protein